ncbi:DUF6265 family protein [Fulvivirga lutea]|uniref:DUF6265 domain-containing protein n=1 Tax=Fulvivirga lutea TaxID=2810512 RepID=A0A975A1U1_9BACT|nr:DUF6265 family protein [Fulvivirga lutea]QSE98186.1 hypothetical protein JR347_03650 [Fulvivirga lutea]
MKLILVIALIFMAFGCQAQKEFSWLEGQWVNQKNGSIEEWVLEPAELRGKVYSVQNGDTTVLEKLAIKKIKDDWFYVADVSHNSEPTHFKMTLIEPGHFICQNPEHDFPKQIEYILKNESLSVIISDGEKKIPFEFKRKK